MGSRLSIEWPPAMGIPASAQISEPPARMPRMDSTGRTLIGMPTTARARMGLPPMA